VQSDFFGVQEPAAGHGEGSSPVALRVLHIFNTPSFTNPTAVFGTATFGNINSTLIPNRSSSGREDLF